MKWFKEVINKKGRKSITTWRVYSILLLVTVIGSYLWSILIDHKKFCGSSGCLYLSDIVLSISILALLLGFCLRKAFYLNKDKPKMSKNFSVFFSYLSLMFLGLIFFYVLIILWPIFSHLAFILTDSVREFLI